MNFLLMFNSGLINPRLHDKQACKLRHCLVHDATISFWLRSAFDLFEKEQVTHVLFHGISNVGLRTLCFVLASSTLIASKLDF